MIHIKDNVLVFLLCLTIGIISWFLGIIFPLAGGPVIAIIIGMILSSFIKKASTTR